MRWGRADGDDHKGRFETMLDVVGRVDREYVRLHESSRSLDQLDAISAQLVADDVVLGFDHVLGAREQVVDRELVLRR